MKLVELVCKRAVIKSRISLFFFIILMNLFVSVSAQKLIHYELFINDTTVNYTGKQVKAIAINGQIPGPELVFTEGDTAEIIVHNLMNKETSIHWHGLILPNDQDGVPYLTYLPIKAHSTFKYYFPIVQNGTYWYHAHTGLQEQIGLYGALIIKKREPERIREYTVLLSDWTNERPMKIMRSLKMANDWYAIEKGSTQDYGAAIKQGFLSTKLKQEWLRMYPMDVSDVYYNAMLINGKTKIDLPEFTAGEKIKLRIINGSASTYFWLQFSGGKMSVIANDGMDVIPVEVDRMLIAVAETYDAIVTIPENMQYEFKATAEDRTKSASLWLGNGMKMEAPILEKLKYFEGMKMMNAMMKFDGSMDAMGMEMSNQQMDMNSVMYPEITGGEKREQAKMEHQHTSSSAQTNLTTLNYAMLKSVDKSIVKDEPQRELNFTLTGNMNRYQWSINNNTLGDTAKILIRKGVRVRIILNNQTMMRHPMHLHGQYFRLLNGQGLYSPLKNVLDIMPMEVDTIEFSANYGGDWFFHCHILYHMMSGMGRVFSVADSTAIGETLLPKKTWKKFIKDEYMWHFTTTLPVHTNGIFPHVMLMNKYYVINAEAMLNYKGRFESVGHFARFIDQRQFLKVFLGGEFRQMEDKLNQDHNFREYKIDNRRVFTIGIQYILPMFVQTEFRLDHNGHFYFQVMRSDLALTNRLRMDLKWNTDQEFDAGLRYIIWKRMSLSANYATHYGVGGGITFSY